VKTSYIIENAEELFVCPIKWAFDDQICAATLEEPTLPGGPEGKKNVPTTLCLTLLVSIHTSLGSGHPGSQLSGTNTGGPAWLRMLLVSLGAVRSVPLLPLHVVYLRASWYCYPFHANPGLILG